METIEQAKNIYIIPAENNEARASALGLFYTLRDAGKNVNIIMPEFPRELNFLAPSLDYISYPKNLVISVPNNLADISQIYYEKTEQDLKIHLTVDKGQLKKENISFYYSESKPDATITVGIEDIKSHLEKNLDSYGFLLNSPVIDVEPGFGKINELIKNPFDSHIGKQAAECFLASIFMRTENLNNENVTPEILEQASQLMKKGADFKKIKDNLNHA